MHKIIKCISNIRDFHKEKYIQLGIGLEIQDFVKPDLLDEGWKERVEEYKNFIRVF